MTIRRFHLLIALAVCCSVNAAAAALVPPAGYTAPVSQNSGAFDCPTLPEPFTGPLDFPSKYEGSGKARDQLNKDSDAEYKARSKPINDMEKGITKLVDKYLETGRPQVLRCAVDSYLAWARAGALEGAGPTHTGRSARKWALASLSGAYLKLKFSSTQPLAQYPAQAASIERWLGTLADKVVSEWDPNQPIEKINNHYYWAAWSVMATSVILDRRDLFDWSTHLYRIFSTQVDEDGYLPNELHRQTRALGYHIYAITPLAMIAAFGKANGLDLAGEGHGALRRVVDVTLQGVENPALFEQRTGKRQEVRGADTQDYELAWLEPYCWTVSCSSAAAQKLASLRPVQNTRLGGDMTRVFTGQ